MSSQYVTKIWPHFLFGISVLQRFFNAFFQHNGSNVSRGSCLKSHKSQSGTLRSHQEIVRKKNVRCNEQFYSFVNYSAPLQVSLTKSSRSSFKNMIHIESFSWRDHTDTKIRTHFLLLHSAVKFSAHHGRNVPHIQITRSRLLLFFFHGWSHSPHCEPWCMSRSGKKPQNRTGFDKT